MFGVILGGRTISYNSMCRCYFTLTKVHVWLWAWTGQIYESVGDICREDRIATARNGWRGLQLQLPFRVDVHDCEMWIREIRTGSLSIWLAIHGIVLSNSAYHVLSAWQ